MWRRVHSQARVAASGHQRHLRRGREHGGHVRLRLPSSDLKGVGAQGSRVSLRRPGPPVPQPLGVTISTSAFPFRISLAHTNTHATQCRDMRQIVTCKNGMHVCVHVHGHACPSTCGYCSAPSRFSLLGRESADSIWKSSSAFDSAPRASRRRRLGPAGPCAVRLCVCTRVCLYACARACAVAASQPTPSATALARSVFAGAGSLALGGGGGPHPLLRPSPVP